jgi:hypothetical protein
LAGDFLARIVAEAYSKRKQEETKKKANAHIAKKGAKFEKGNREKKKTSGVSEIIVGCNGIFGKVRLLDAICTLSSQDPVQHQHVSHSPPVAAGAVAQPQKSKGKALKKSASLKHNEKVTFLYFWLCFSRL